jgi:hypothetical protein
MGSMKSNWILWKIVSIPHCDKMKAKKTCMQLQKKYIHGFRR